MSQTYSVEFRDHEKRERILFETDDHVSYAWTLFELSAFPGRYNVITASPLVVTPTGELVRD